MRKLALVCNHTWNWACTFNRTRWMLFYFFLGGGIPLIFLVFEFYNPVSPRSNAEFTAQHHEFFFSVIKAYSPLFLYAVIAGFYLPNYIVPVYQYFKSIHFNEKIHKVRRILVKVAFLVSLVVAFSDFFGGQPAIWELRPPYHEQFIPHFIHAGKSTVVAEKEAFKAGINENLSTINRWSVTRYSYFFSVLIEAFFLISFFFLSFFFYAFRKPLKDKNEAAYHKCLNGLMISSFLIFVWLILRTMNSTEKNSLYPDADLQVANIAIWLLNLLCLVTVTLCRLSNSKIRKAAETMIGLIAALGISAGTVIGFVNPDTLVLFFGRDAATLNYIVFPIVFILLYGACFIVDLGKQYGQEYEVLNPLVGEEEG